MPRLAAAFISAALGLALLAPASGLAGDGLRFFHTADDNISCGLAKGVKKKRHKHPRLPGVARCDVKSHTWTAPPAPKWCDLDWGFGVQVGEKRGGTFVCAGDTVEVPNSPVLNPGDTIGVGRYSCSVLPTGVRCTNTLNGHGFEVSATQVSLF